MLEVINSMNNEAFGITAKDKEAVLQRIQSTVIPDPTNTEHVIEALNHAFNHTWSFHSQNVLQMADAFVVCIGQLVIPGFGVREGVGQAQGNDVREASGDALRNAVSTLGFGTKETKPTATAEMATAVEAPEPVAPPERPTVTSARKIPATPAEKAVELKEAYGIKTKSQFLGFAQIWNPKVQTFADITDDRMNQLHAYVEENHVEFEDYNASNY